MVEETVAAGKPVSAPLQYVIVSPVRDEAALVERTLRSVTEQTVKPMAWVIVDDGSVDQTRAMVEKYAAKYPWITLHARNQQIARQPGANVVRAFQDGFERVRELPFELVVKLDCDVDLPLHYFEQLLMRFEQDEKLGIASGVYREQNAQGWHEIAMPEYHAAGASKVIRAACFAEIGGFVPSRGWDTVDEIRAQVMGWRTTHFTDLVFEHLKPEGTGIGFLRTNVMHGEIFYLTGGGALFLFFKTLHRLWTGRPCILAALAMLYGFVKKWIAGSPRLVSKEEARHYRSLLNHRILRPFGAKAPRLEMATRSNS
jgi:glycosyltransferase involved in cell wall biosynthesis